jgi:hypothetical protein
VSLLCACIIMIMILIRALCDTTQTHGTRVGAQIREPCGRMDVQSSRMRKQRKDHPFLSCLLGDRDLWRWLDGG